MEMESQEERELFEAMTKYFRSGAPFNRAFELLGRAVDHSRTLDEPQAVDDYANLETPEIVEKIRAEPGDDYAAAHEEAVLVPSLDFASTDANKISELKSYLDNAHISEGKKAATRVLLQFLKDREKEED